MGTRENRLILTNNEAVLTCVRKRCFSAMLTDAFQEVDAGFPIRYRFDSKLLNLRRQKAKSKV